MRSIVSVLVPASTIDLTLLATVKTELGITDTSQDAALSSWITQASQAAASYCNRVFAQETVQETFRPTRAIWYSESFDALYLSRTPIASITSVTVDGTALSASEYEFDATSGALYYLQASTPTYWAFATSIVVVYVGGYELLDTLPHDIERAVIAMVSDLRADAARGGGDQNLVEKEIEGVSRYRWASGSSSSSSTNSMWMPAPITGLLDPYVRRWGYMR